jgi:hypothetical protein
VGYVTDRRHRGSRADSVTAMTNDHASEPKKLPTKTLLVGMDLGHTYRVFNEYRPFEHGERIPVDPPGTVAIVRGSRTVETEGGELMLEYVVELEQPGNGVSQS